MFGLLSPARRDAAFCRAYSHLCQSHRKAAGLAMLPFHSYESVAIYLLAVDAGLVTLDDKPTRVCCQLQKQKVLSPEEERVSRFCSSLSTLLAYIKLRDDAFDEYSIRARLLLFLFSRRFKGAYRHFEAIDSEFRKKLTTFIDRHIEIERGRMPVELEEFSRPTSRGFGYLFSLLPRLCARADVEPIFRTIGEHIGAAIVTFDAAHDYASDKKTKNYNPLADENQVSETLEYAKQRLRAAALASESTFGMNSISAQHLRSVEASLIMDTEMGVTKSPSLLDEAVLQQCAPQNAFLGCIPIPFLADSESKCTNKDLGIFACILCAAGVNAASKNTCLGSNKPKVDGCGKVTVHRKGCCDT